MEVEKKVDEYMGFQDLVMHASEMNHQYLNKYTLYFKYNLIIEVTINLDESFNQIRTCVLKEISLVYFSPMKLLGIPEFTTGLISTLEKKNLATDFRKKIVKLWKREQQEERKTKQFQPKPETPEKKQRKSSLMKNTEPNAVLLELRMKIESRI